MVNPDLKNKVKPTISGIVITYNEEQNLRDCLLSLKWVDELLVVDAESTDATCTIAGEYTKRVFVRPWPGFGAQKNFAIDQVTSDWVLIVDADERVNHDLAREIQNTLAGWTTSDPIAFRIPRLNFFYGQPVRWGGTYPDYQIRLFRKGLARYNNVQVHENLLVQGDLGTLTAHLDHYTERCITDHFRKFGKYTTLAAQEKGKSKQTVSWYHLVVNPFVVFIKAYFLKQGFREGIRGMILAVFAGMYTFVKYAKLWEMRHPSPLSSSKRE